MMPLVEPPELEPIFAKARARIEPPTSQADYVWAVGNPADKIAATARDRDARLVVARPRTTTASSAACSARTSPPRSSGSSARASSSSTDPTPARAAARHSTPDDAIRFEHVLRARFRAANPGVSGGAPVRSEDLTLMADGDLVRRLRRLPDEAPGRYRRASRCARALPLLRGGRPALRGAGYAPSRSTTSAGLPGWQARR